MTGYAQLSARAQKELDEWVIKTEAELRKEWEEAEQKLVDLSEVVRTFDILYKIAGIRRRERHATKEARFKK